MKGLYSPESLGRVNKELESPFRQFMGSNMFNPKNSHQRTPDKIAADAKLFQNGQGFEAKVENLSLVPPGERPAVMKSFGQLKQFGK